jgi:hypothetical protein
VILGELLSGMLLELGGDCSGVLAMDSAWRLKGDC